MTDIRDTSLEAYEYVNSRGITATQEARIAAYLYGRNPLTRQEISRGTGIAINAVCGRVNTLVKERHLEEHAKRPCSITGRNAHPLVLAPPPPREPHQEVLL